jgi:phosphoglycolate phosphatase
VYRALEQLGVECSRALYVGDSEVDAATAKNAGLDAAIVGWGYRDPDFLLQHGAAEVVESFDQLLEKII